MHSLSKGFYIRRRNSYPPLPHPLLTTQVPSWSVDISFKDDVTAILHLLSVSLIHLTHLRGDREGGHCVSQSSAYTVHRIWTELVSHSKSQNKSVHFQLRNSGKKGSHKQTKLLPKL